MIIFYIGLYLVIGLTTFIVALRASPPTKERLLGGDEETVMWDFGHAGEGIPVMMAFHFCVWGWPIVWVVSFLKKLGKIYENLCNRLVKWAIRGTEEHVKEMKEQADDELHYFKEIGK